jgi:hypothetical protein
MQNRTAHVASKLRESIGPAIVLSMFLLSFIFGIVVLGIEYVDGIYCLFISVIPLEIQLSSRKDMDSITRFNPHPL